ncbi:MAG: hypothetical protein RLZZ46_480 [Bacteroidota bacterium]
MLLTSHPFISLKSAWCRFILLLTPLVSGEKIQAQIPVELFSGNKKSSVDIMFFKFLKNKDGNNSRVLFFNRNRAVIDYQMTSNTYLPQFGFTEAFSFNHPSLKGFAPVGVVQIFGTGVFAKAGIQFARITTHSTFFSWLVCETRQSPAIDLFFLGRYTPPLTEKWNLFLQLELVNAFPSNQQRSFSFTQRARAGLKQKAFQFGLGSDYSQTGRGTFSSLLNTGGFIRYEF